MRDNGAVQGGSDAFQVGDPVLVLKKFDSKKVYVVGFVDGIKECSFYIVEIRNLAGTVKRYWRIGKDGTNTEITPEVPTWKYRLFSGQDDPITFAPTVEFADRIPSKTMEWVPVGEIISGSPAIIDFPVTPKYKPSMVESIDEETDQEDTETITYGVIHDNAVEAAMVYGPGNYRQSAGSTAWGGRQTLNQFLTYKVNGVEIIGPPFSSEESVYDASSSWNMTGGITNYNGVEELSGQEIDKDEDAYKAIGDKKVFGMIYTTAYTWREGSTVNLTGPHSSYHKSSFYEETGVATCGPLMYGRHVLREQSVSTFQINSTFELTVAPVPLVFTMAPATGTYTHVSSGLQHWPSQAFGSGDEEFVASYTVITIAQNQALNASEAYLYPWHGDENVPCYWRHGNYGSPKYDEVPYVPNSYVYKMAFRVKETITQIDLCTSPYIPILQCRECDTHFVVLHSKGLYTEPSYFFTYELIVINKVTGGYERIPLGDETTWGQNLRIAYKGQGPDVYTPPPTP